MYPHILPNYMYGASAKLSWYIREATLLPPCWRLSVVSMAHVPLPLPSCGSKAPRMLQHFLLHAHSGMVGAEPVWLFYFTWVLSQLLGEETPK